MTLLTHYGPNWFKLLGSTAGYVISFWSACDWCHLFAPRSMGLDAAFLTVPAIWARWAGGDWSRNSCPDGKPTGKAGGRLSDQNPFWIRHGFSDKVKPCGASCHTESFSGLFPKIGFLINWGGGTVGNDLTSVPFGDFLFRQTSSPQTLWPMPSTNSSYWQEIDGWLNSYTSKKSKQICKL